MFSILLLIPLFIANFSHCIDQKLSSSPEVREQQLFSIAHDSRIFIKSQQRMNENFAKVQYPEFLELLKDTEKLYQFGRTLKKSFEGPYTRESVKAYYKPLVLTYQDYLLKSNLSLKDKLHSILHSNYMSFNTMQERAKQILDDESHINERRKLILDIKKYKRMCLPAAHAYKRHNKLKFKKASDGFPEILTLFPLEKLLKDYYNDVSETEHRAINAEQLLKNPTRGQFYCTLIAARCAEIIFKQEDPQLLTNWFDSLNPREFYGYFTPNSPLGITSLVLPKYIEYLHSKNISFE